MKITVVHLINDLERAGAQQMVLSIVRAHDLVRFEPVVVMWGGLDDLKSAVEELGVRVVDLGGTGKFSLRALSRLTRELRRLRPDVLHTHLMHMHVVGRLAAKATGVPVVVSTHHNLRLGNHVLMRIAERITRPLSTVTTTVTEAAEVSYFGQSALFSEDAFAAGRRHFTIPNGLALDRLEEIRLCTDTDAVRARLGIRQEFVLTCVGRLHRSKGHGYLLEAMGEASGKVEGLRLLLVGDGDRRSALEVQIEELGLGPVVTILGHRSDAMEIVAASDGFVLASILEGFGLAVAEAMMLGVPVISTNLDAIQEVAGTCGKLVAPRSPHALAEAIIALVREQPQRAQEGIDRVRARFDIEVVLRQYERLYSLALGSDPASAT
ncbi:glycosyltransferase [Planctomycetota bacterium]|nr:glycosyltransferase [Planctomycetota bacterium]